jgi:hypothetical protein
MWGDWPCDKNAVEDEDFPPPPDTVDDTAEQLT